MQKTAILLSYYSHPSLETNEIIDLAHAGGYEIVYHKKVITQKYYPETFLSHSKIQDVLEETEDMNYNYVLLNQGVTPYQYAFLEKTFDKEILDKIMLVLEIFENKASSKEVQLQIELAQIQYSRPRITRGLRQGVIREKQARSGGIGEQLKDIMSADIRKRSSQISKKLQNRSQPTTGDDSIPKIPIIGFYSAGKSTLFNILVGNETQETDIKAFTTMFIKQSRSKILGFPVDFVDTVGLVDLPTTVLNAFNQLLDPIYNSKILIVMIDVSLDDQAWKIHFDYLKKTIQEFINRNQADPRLIIVLSKSDLTSPETIESRIQNIQNDEKIPPREVISVTMKDPESLISAFKSTLSKILQKDIINFTFEEVSPSLLSFIYENSEVDQVEWNQNGTSMVSGKTIRGLYIEMQRKLDVVS